MLQRLLDVGFEKIADWDLTAVGVNCDLPAEASTTGVLYSFVSGKTVMYVGKSIQSLKTRIYGYIHPGPTQTTNIRINHLIREHIGLGKQLSIFVFFDPGLIKYGGFHLNLAAGLEDDIISTLSPDWNLVVADLHI